MHEVRTKNANGRRRRKVVRERAMKLLDIVRETPGERLGFYNEALGVPNGYRETAERCLIEDGLVSKVGNRRGARLFPVIPYQTDEPVEPHEEQSIGELTTQVFPNSDFSKATLVSSTTMFSGFPAKLAERVMMLEEEIFYLVSAIESYMDGEISGNQMRAAIVALEQRRV